MNFRQIQAFALAALLAVATFAQSGNPNQAPTFTDTSLTAAITSTSLTMAVASASGFTANSTLAQIDDEFVAITSVSGLNIGISRGRSGSRATNHGTTARVRVAPNANFSACGGVTNGFTPCGSLYNTMASNRYSSGLFFPNTTVTTLTTASALTYTTGQILGGMILRDPNGASRTDTFPTAILLVAAMPGATIGSTFDVWVRNDADAAETITIAAGTGGTVTGGGTMTIAQNNSKMLRVRLTGVASGSEAYIIYSLGTATF